MKKLIFKDNSSGTIQHFPGVGDWKSGEHKDVDDLTAEILLEFPSIEEIIESVVKEKIIPVLAEIEEHKVKKKRKRSKIEENIDIEIDVEEE